MGNTTTKQSLRKTNSINGTYHPKQQNSLHEINSLRSHCSYDRGSQIFKTYRESSFKSKNKEIYPVTQVVSLFLPVFPVQFDFAQPSYEILEKKATGSYGKVFKAKNKETGSVFALKVVSKALIIKQDCIGRIKEEVQIQKAVGHFRFIVDCLQSWQSKKDLYIATEYLVRGDLFDFMQKYLIPVEVVRIYTAQLGSALDYLQNAGVIYRDLKPENVVLDERLNAKLTDFGFARWLSYGLKTKTFCGSLKYMAPEILTRDWYGHACDWWSLGVVVSLMLSGYFPALEPQPSDEVRAENVQLPGNLKINPSINELLMGLLEIDPSKRIRNLRNLLNIRFFKSFKIDELTNGKLVPLDLYDKFRPNPFKLEQIDDFDIPMYQS